MFSIITRLTFLRFLAFAAAIALFTSCNKQQTTREGVTASKPGNQRNPTVEVNVK